MVRATKRGVCWWLFASQSWVGFSFVVHPAILRSPSALRMNFFKDMLQGAFENDTNLSSDKSKGQYDDEYDIAESESPRTSLTATQERWRQKQQGSPLSPAMLEGVQIAVDFYLTGVPTRDPSNDLFASRVNISSRDRDVGLALPDQPSTSAIVEFLPNQVCRVVEPTAFCQGDGEWKLSDDGTMLRFSLQVSGFSRTVQTTGTIQNVYWTKEDDVSTQTSSTYRIPPGYIYSDVKVETGRQPGTVAFPEDGLLRVEQKMGLMGAASKMVPCGKIQTRILENGSDS